MARGEKPRYDGRWRPENARGKTPPAGVAPVIRFRNPDDGVVAWDDARQGPHRVSPTPSSTISSSRARDGTPTYNFCVVVDDLDMRITHVIRGDDHVNNTPRQINILRALGADAARLRALPTVLGEDGAKLSKRHGAVSASCEYEAEGYLPEAMVNFLARIGWAHGDDEIFTRDELVEWFDLDGHHPAPSRFDSRKLQLGQPGAHEARCREASSDGGSSRFSRARDSTRRAGPPPARSPRCCAIASTTLVEMADAAHYFYATPHPAPDKVAEFVNDGNRAALVELRRRFRGRRLDARGDRRGDQGRRGAARTEAAAGDDAAAHAGVRNAADARDRRGARAARPRRRRARGSRRASLRAG